jgi:cytochrome P450
MAQVDSDMDEIFRRFNDAMGVGTVDDVYTDVSVDRDKHLAFFGILPLAGGTRNYALQALSFEAVEEILRDGKRFSSSAYSEILGPVFGRSILEMDEPEHRSYRALLQRAFTRNELRKWESTLIQPVVDRLIDRFASSGRAELVSQFTFPFPLEVSAGLLDLPLEERRTFHRLAIELISVTVDMPTASRASAALGELLQPLIDERRVRPGADIISVLAAAEFEGRQLTNEEILSFCRLLAPAGVETTYRSSSNVLFGLLTHPVQLAAVREDRSLIPQAIEEGLRWECPTPAMVRRATRDTEVCGVGIRAGTFILAHVGAANRDPARWDNPDAFDIFRPARPNLATGTGPHSCLGTHLTRMEVAVALNRLFDRLPETLRLDPNVEVGPITGLMFRSPRALPVVFD